MDRRKTMQVTMYLYIKFKCILCAYIANLFAKNPSPPKALLGADEPFTRKEPGVSRGPSGLQAADQRRKPAPTAERVVVDDEIPFAQKYRRALDLEQRAVFQMLAHKLA